MTARVIMVQGTASSVGKSLLVTALCRIFRQDGWRVAPFKAQNMSLNSFVTPDGREIGRAQAVQAAAARIEPTVDMNPVLLKPEVGARSQVVVLGRPVGTLDARASMRSRKDLWPVVAASLERLMQAYDLVVIEGAGSPAEVNLRASDIVNMRVARHVNAPVLLVGDIDRGGVFASLVGTLVLLEPEERHLVKGLVINKFRGDLGLLEPGLVDLAERTGKPVLGVIPYLRDLLIASEDSVSLEDARPHERREAGVDIAIIRLPHIANFDDFDLLAREPGAGIRYVERLADLGAPDAIILPGTKTTVADLRWLVATGLAARVVALARRGTPVLGVCGGYQMLGERLQDLLGIESSEGDVGGLGLLPVTTVFAQVKATDRVEATVGSDTGLFGAARGTTFTAYEIHMGRTTWADPGRSHSGPVPFFVRSRTGQATEEPGGAMRADGLVVGTYLHGLFESPPLRRAFVEAVARCSGIQLFEAAQPPSREAEYDRLAATVRESLDMERLGVLCGL